MAQPPAGVPKGFYQALMNTLERVDAPHHCVDLSRYRCVHQKGHAYLYPVTALDVLADEAPTYLPGRGSLFPK